MAGSKPQSHADDRETDESPSLMEETLANKSNIGAVRWPAGGHALLAGGLGLPTCCCCCCCQGRGSLDGGSEEEDGGSGSMSPDLS